ncbi:MAG: methylmalonyl-CoA mutase family protein, partial [Gaiellales bacterium]
GSYYIESLTGQLEQGAMLLIERVDELGGAVAAIEAGFIQAEIEDSAYQEARRVESGERVIVGVNAYTEGADDDVPIHRLDPELESRQIERTRHVRATRDIAAAQAALEEVRACTHTDRNLLVPMRAALATGCTVGEVSQVLRDEFGTYDS